MPAYQLDQFLPDIDPSCWIAPCATIIGNVVVGSGSSIWFGSVVRGDNEPIVIGERINIRMDVSCTAILAARCVSETIQR